MIKKLFYHIIIVSLVFNSCNKQSELLESKNIVVNSKILDISFPDTVLIGQNTLGEIKYDLRTVSIDPLDIYERYIILYISTNKNALSLEEIEKIDHKAFIDTIGDGSFHFNAMYTNLGNNLLNGVIEDMYTTKGSSIDTVNVIRERSSFSLKVYVKD